MIIRSITLAAGLAQIVPPDGEAHPGPIQWTVELPAGTTVSEDAVGSNEATLTAAQTLVFVGENEELFAANSSGGNAIVIGCHYPV